MPSPRPLPDTLPLHAAPLIPINLAYPPSELLVGVGRHGRLPVEHYNEPYWYLHFYRWTGVLSYQSQNQRICLPIRTGYCGFLPPMPLSHYFGQNPATHFFALFQLPVVKEEAPLLYLPAMQDLGEDFGTFCTLLERAVAAYPSSPRRAAAVLWDILWRLAERSPRSVAEKPRLHPAVVKTQELIELRLGEPLRVREIAQTVELSHNHLTRLFREATGGSVVAYIRERRVAQALQLLKHTTVPIKTIAAQVGFYDLHQFNKAIRAATGLSPRRHREHN